MARKPKQKLRHKCEHYVKQGQWRANSPVTLETQARPTNLIRRAEAEPCVCVCVCVCFTVVCVQAYATVWCAILSASSVQKFLVAVCVWVILCVSYVCVCLCVCVVCVCVCVCVCV